MASTVICSPHTHFASTTTDQVNDASSLEERLKYITQIKRIRVSEFFKDFDPLRSGFITKTQFRRCMDQHLGLPISDEEYAFLLRKYDTTGNGMINYCSFVDTMENGFNPNQLDGNPKEQIEINQRTPTTLTSTTLSPDNKDKTDELLLKCAQYYKSRGISVRLSYQDFDRHHMGFITLSQFHRAFPGPPEVSENDISLLAQRYYDPMIKLYNYFCFNQDIKGLWESSRPALPLVPKPPSPPKQEVASLEEIFQRIRDVVYKHGIRTTEFFRDHDKLRSGIITENQFICGLSLSVGQRAHLTREEINKIVNYYRISDGRVKYKELCDMMENAFNVPNLEKKPTQSVFRPLRGHLYRSLNTLSSSSEESQLEFVLWRLKGEVKKRRLLLYPYFRDFDRGKGYTRGVTKPQFERILHIASLSVTSEEMKLIQRKFEDPIGGDINYSAFIQAIDEEYTGQDVERNVTIDSPSPEVTVSIQDPVNVITDLIPRIREHVLVNRIRVSEHFQDFDPLRSGFISTERFRQGLNAMGLPHISAAQFEGLCQHYSDHRQPDTCAIAWKIFLHDIDKVFEQWPNEPSNKPNLLPMGALDFQSCATEHQKQVLVNALKQMSDVVSQRRTLVKPCFQDFDRHNIGYVTPAQLHRCLSYLELPATDEEVAVISLRFSDANGFNYLKFLAELQPQIPFVDKYEQRLSMIKADKKRAVEMESYLANSMADLDSLADQAMDRIKTKVIKERVRVLEFMRDYDKLRSGRIPVTSFRRALDLCGFGLNIMEVQALENRYRSSKDENYVNYIQFSDEIESIFTIKELEKMPTVEVSQFVPPVEVDLNQLSPEEEQTLQKCMHRLAERVRVRRIQLFPLFEDYDRVHIGSVTKGQFHRVLSELDLSGLVSKMEFGIIYSKFCVQVGGRNDVNYNAFCSMAEEYAQTRWTDPALK